MTTKDLQQKTARYLQDRALPAEKGQLQNWLSCTAIDKMELSDEEKVILENQILSEIQAYTAYPLFHPRPEPWWKKFTAIF